MIRSIFFALLLANIVYFGWNYADPPRPQNVVLKKIPLQAKVLRLLSERTQARAPAEALDPEQPSDMVSEAQAPPPEPANKRCYSLGPFDGRPAAELWAQRIEVTGFPVAVRAIDERQRSTFWVYIAPVKDHQTALRIGRKLANKGIKDYFVVTDDDNPNAVSLGLFSRQEGAQRRLAQIRSLGFEPKIDVKHEEKTSYWLDYDETKGDPLPDLLWQSIAAENKTIQRIPRECS